MNDTLAAIVVAGIGAGSALAGIAIQRQATNRNATLDRTSKQTEWIVAAQSQLTADIRTARDECEAELVKANERINQLETEVDRLNLRIARFINKDLS